MKAYSPQIPHFNYFQRWLGARFSPDNDSMDALLCPRDIIKSVYVARASEAHWFSVTGNMPFLWEELWSGTGTGCPCVELGFPIAMRDTVH